MRNVDFRLFFNTQATSAIILDESTIKGKGVLWLSKASVGCRNEHKDEASRVLLFLNKLLIANFSSSRLATQDSPKDRRNI